MRSPTDNSADGPEPAVPEAEAACLGYLELLTRGAPAEAYDDPAAYGDPASPAASAATRLPGADPGTGRGPGAGSPLPSAASSWRCVSAPNSKPGDGGKPS